MSNLKTETEPNTEPVVAQPKIETVTNRRRLRPQRPLQGLRPELPPKPPYDKDAKPGYVYMSLEWRVWSRDELILTHTSSHVVADGYLVENRARVPSSFEKFGAEDFDNAKVRLSAWASKVVSPPKTVPTAMLPAPKPVPSLTDVQAAFKDRLKIEPNMPAMGPEKI